MRLSPLPRTARPFLVLAVSLVAQLSAGMLYWWPALTPGLKHHLHLTNGQATALVVTANSGSLLGILGGFFHTRYGSRATATTGALGLAFCYATLARLVAIAPPPMSNVYVFALCIAIALTTVTFSYMVYSSSMSAAASLFPRAFRGRIVGLCASMYGGAAGFAGSVQSGFFPSLQDTHALLIFVSAFAFLPGLLALFLFPDKETFRVNPSVLQSQNYVSLRTAQAPITTTPTHIMPLEDITGHIEPRLRSGYVVAWALVGSIQVSVIAGVLDLSSFMQRWCAIAVILAILCYAILPLRSSLVVESETMPGDRELQNSEPLPPFISVAMDLRYLYLCLGCTVLVAGGGIALLVQAPSIIERNLFMGKEASSVQYDAELVNRLTRVLVVIFSACNLTARLGVGGIMDWGQTAVERLLWKYDIMVTGTFFMGIALLAIAFVQSTAIFVAVAMIGFCYGTWYSTTPTLTTLWFGVRSFPRNFALVGPFVTIGSLTLASTVPNLLRSMFGEWVELKLLDGPSNQVEQVCNSLLCSAPTFCLLGMLQFIMYALGLKMRSSVQEKAEVHGF